MTAKEIYNYIISNSEWKEHYNVLRDKDKSICTFNQMAKNLMKVAYEIEDVTEEDIKYTVEDMFFKMDSERN